MKVINLRAMALVVGLMSYGATTMASSIQGASSLDRPVAFDGATSDDNPFADPASLDPFNLPA